jgi:hypothetical protein
VTCLKGKSRPSSLYEAKEALGWGHGYPASESEKRHVVKGQLVERTPQEILEVQIAREKTMAGGGAEMFICGSFKPGDLDVCTCGYFADLLCDYPMGGGKTCDAPLCPDCAHEVGEDRHLCLIHFGQYRGAARVNPWPPRKGGTP